MPRPITTPFVDTLGLTLAEHSVAFECSASTTRLGRSSAGELRLRVPGWWGGARPRRKGWRTIAIIGFFDAYPAMRGRDRELVGGVALQLGI